MTTATLDDWDAGELDDGGYDRFTDWFFDEAMIPLLTAALGLSLCFAALLSLYGCVRVLTAFYGLLSEA